MTFLVRRLSATFKLGTGNFGQGPAESDTVALPNHRLSCTIVKNGLPGYNSAELRIFGMTRSTMNKLSTLGMPRIYDRKNTIEISAGDDRAGMALVYSGIIKECWIDFDGMPDVFLNVQSYAGLIDRMKPVPPTSYPGSADVATIMAGLAERMGRKFENSGVVGVTLASPYFPGTALEQAMACARAANINIAAEGEGDSGVLAIWPKNGSRNGSIPLISPSSGLVGYPGYCDTGITFRTLFNPSLVFGGKVKIEEAPAPVGDTSPVNGEWIVNGLSYDLSSETAGGPWFCNCKAYRFGNPATVVSR